LKTKNLKEEGKDQERV